MAANNNASDLLEYTRTYHARLSELLGTVETSTFPYHHDRTEIIALIRASDGCATFYLPAPQDQSIAPGYYEYDLSSYDLNRVCQSLSVHRLQVAPPRIGESWDAMLPIYSPTEAIPEFSAPWIHDDIRTAAISGNIESLPGMTISPIVHVESGIRKHVVPARVKILAPVFQFPGIGFRRLYLWTHADFWWMPEQLDLSAEASIKAAESDFFSFQTILTSSPVLAPGSAETDVNSHATDILISYCDEFVALLEEFGHDEEKLHQWLYDPRHQVFLSQNAKRIWSKLPFGPHVSDFVVRRSDTTYELIEIENATTRIFRMSDSEPSAPFNHARQQVRDWKRYIRDNTHTVRVELQLDDIDNPDGMVVIGRSRDIDTDAARIRWRDLKATGDMKVFTYDELIDSVRALADTLRKVMRAG